MRCGDAEYPFGLLKRVADAVCDIQYGTGGYARSLASTTVGFDTLDLIQHSRNECTRPECKISGPESFLGLLLKVLLQCTATNDRDLVYAFLAFQDPNSPKVIKPEYGQTVEATWTDAAVYIIKSSQSLDLFLRCFWRSTPRFTILGSRLEQVLQFRQTVRGTMQSAFCAGGRTKTPLAGSGAVRGPTAPRQRKDH